MTDFQLSGHPGSTIYLLRPETDGAQRWIDAHISPDAQYFGPAVVVEHRFIANLIDGLRADGLSIEGEALS